MKEPVLIIIKPDGMVKSLPGYLLTRLAETGLNLVAARLVAVSRKLAEEHYKDHRKKFFFEEIVQYLSGKLHKDNKVLALVYYGDAAIQKARDLTGATSPEAANPKSIRGSCGRITTKGIYENVLHVSSTRKECERELKLWFAPDEIHVKLYKTKVIKGQDKTKRVWA